MKRYPAHRHTARKMLCIALSAGIALPLPALSASVSLATTPLATATNTTVLPNLMFIIDSSGSMGWNYLPDWVNDNLCKNTSGSYNASCVNQPPFQSPDFNGIYYNPEINYVPAVNADGTSKPSQTTWTSVKNDAYGIQSTGSTNLVTSYVDIEWCTDTSYTDCLRNDNYLLPGVVDGKTYNRMRTTTSSGSGYVATGTPSVTTTAARTWGPHYYRIIPGEYCDSAKLTNCQPTQTATYSYPAKLRWCNSEANATAATPAAGSCQGLRTSSYTYARYPTKFPSTATNPGSPAVPASVSFDVNVSCSGNKKVSVGSVKVGTSNIIGSATSTTNSSSTLASLLASKINGGGSIYSASSSNKNLTITAPVSAGNVTANVTLGNFTYSGSSGSCTVSVSPATPQFSGYHEAIPASGYPGFVRVDIVPGQTYPRGPGRTDCTTSTSYCTYAEEMTNFANWWTYYQTRMQAMKTAASRAFKPIDNRYRVGFIDLWGNNYLPIARFDAGPGNAKDLWYAKLFSMNPANGTPLRSALARVGLIFAGKKPVGSSDPVQYSCQQNFALLTTDGYWNTDNYDSSTNSYYPTTGNNGSDIKKIDGTKIGDQDGGATARPMYEGPTATYNTLADVAKYYYDTDIRDPSFGNCTGSLGTDVCTNNVFISNTDTNTKQHMTTFTLGLGVDGTLNYTSDYATATSGDYYNLTRGTGSPVVNWPVPSADSETAVDDLWHAAVNGRGTYFSAKDPAQLTNGLNGALAALNSKVGAGAAAATSTLNPVAGDNFAFVASYTTVKWQGNLEARSIDLQTGVVSRAATWCVENVIAGTCSAPGTIVPDTSGGSTVYNCVTPNSTADTCSGVLDGTNCKVQMPVACTGTLASKVGASTDTRRIFMSNGASLVDFTYDNLSATQKTYFTGTSLSQWADLDATQKSKVTGANLVNFLRGQTGYEDRASNVTTSGTGTIDNRLFRYREATLGDALESQPAFIGMPYFNYTDAGYSDFVAAKANRPKTVYIGTNDGMLHAFDATDGTERWAFVPSMVIPNLWKLADKNYATMHTNYVNGRPIIGDVYDSSTNSWRTILVGGLNGGGRGYYALDITDPNAPALLWEIDSNTEPNLGYSFGYPVITKKSDGTWVVLLSSGYNNTNPGDGKGYLFIRNALTGAHISRISTGTGDTTTPSGLGRIANWGDDPDKNNLSVYAYAGDLLGNLWRFDINAGTVMKLAILKDSSGASAKTQPITTRPELGRINNKRVVFVATGKYLETSDLEDSQQQSVYAIKDDDVTTTLDNPRLSLVQQTITTSGATRTATANPVDFTSGRGWFVDLPDSRERVHVDPVLDSGLLIVASTVTSNAVCTPGGYGWLNYFNYKTGNNVTDIVSQKYDAPIVGLNVIYTSAGRVVSAVRADDPTPTTPPQAPPASDGSSGFVGKRVIWRELIQ